jgi:hypothetical protein
MFEILLKFSDAPQFRLNSKISDRLLTLRLLCVSVRISNSLAKYLSQKVVYVYSDKIFLTHCTVLLSFTVSEVIKEKETAVPDIYVTCKLPQLILI